MSLYANVKTFALAAVKPLIQALRTRFDYQVKYINKRVNAQDDSFMQLQKDFAELNKKVVEGTDAYLEYRKQLQGFEAKLYTADQVKALDRRVQQLLIVINELYILISNKLPNEELPDLDPWLPDDPIPLASDFEAEWRKELQVDPDVELTEEQRKMADEYIRSRYLTYPYLPDYPTNEDGSFLTDEQIEEFWHERNGVAGDAELTAEQERDIQAYKDAYEYVYRQAPKEDEEETPTPTPPVEEPEEPAPPVGE